MNCQQNYPMLPPAYGSQQQPNVTINMPQQQQPNPTIIMAPQQQQPPNPTIIVAAQQEKKQQPMNIIMVGKTPVQTTCNNCRNQVVTRVEKKKKGKVYCISCLVFFTVVGALGCCLIPCCVDSLKVFHHTCPNCKSYIGRYEE